MDRRPHPSNSPSSPDFASSLLYSSPPSTPTSSITPPTSSADASGSDSSPTQPQCPICFNYYSRDALPSHVGEHFVDSPAQPERKKHKTSEKSTMRNDRRINSPGTNKAAQGGDGSFIGWSSPSKPMKCPLPDCTCVIRPDEWEEHLQLHEIESALVRLILFFFHLLDPHFLCCFEFAFSLGLQSHRLRRQPYVAAGREGTTRQARGERL